MATPLLEAVKERNFVTVCEILHPDEESGEKHTIENILLSLGDNKDIENSALLLATIAGDSEVVKELLKQGADPSVKVKGYSVLHEATGREYTTIMTQLISRAWDHIVEAPENKEDIATAVRQGEKCLTEMMKTSKVPINVTTQDTLIMASLVGRKDIVELLLKHGVGKDAGNKMDYLTKPLIIAASEDHEDIVHFLLAKEADVNGEDEEGKTALMLATKYGHTHMAKLLIENGADVNASDEYGKTVLMIAAKKGHEDIVSVLLDNGVEVNCQDEFDRTALVMAIRKKCKGVASMLLDRGAKVNNEDDERDLFRLMSAQ